MKLNDSQKEQVNKVAEVLNPKTITEVCPILLVGRAVTWFKLIYKDQIVELDNAEDVREVVSEYTGVSSSKPVVISDLSNINYNSTFLLLKLVEEAKFPVILLSTQDNIDSIILSRIKTVIKFPLDENSSNSLLSVQDAFEFTHKTDEQTHMMNDSLKLKYYAENCPQLYEISKDIPFTKKRDMLIKILGDNYDN